MTGAELLNDIINLPNVIPTEPYKVEPPQEPASTLKLRVRSRAPITDFNGKSKRHFVAPLGVYGIVVGKVRMGLVVCWDAGVSFAGDNDCRTETDWTCAVNVDTLEFAGLVEVEDK